MAKPWEKFSATAVEPAPAVPPEAPPVTPTPLMPTAPEPQPMMQATRGLPEDIGEGADIKPWESLLQGIGQGGTFGFGDEAAAMLRTGGERLFGIDRGGDLADHYRNILKQQRGYMERTKEANPGTFLSGELTTGFAQGFGGAGKAAGGLAIKEAMPRIVGSGIAMGAVAGSGYSDADNALQANIDSASAAAFGGAFSAAIPGAGALARQVSKVFRDVNADELAAKMVLQELHNAGMTPKMATEMLKENPALVVADLGQNLQSLAGEVARSPKGRAPQAMTEFLTGRNREQVTRILPKIAKALGGVSQNFRKVQRDLKTQFKGQADELYKEAYATPMQPTNQLMSLLKTPAAQDALQNVNKIAKQSRMNMGEGEFNMLKLDYVARQLNDKVGRLYKDGFGTEAGAVKETLNELKDELFRQNPAYARARSIWSGGRADETAMELGEKAIRGDADELRFLLEDMSQSERAHFRIGAMRGIQRAIGGAGSMGGDVVKKLSGGYNQNQVLKEIFPTKKLHADFMKTLRQEEKMFETFKSLSGSDTAKKLGREAESGEQLGMLTAIALGAKTGIPIAGLPFVGRKVGRRVGEKVADLRGRVTEATGPMLQSRDPAMLAGLAERAAPPMRYPGVPRPTQAGQPLIGASTPQAGYGGLAPTSALTSAGLVPGLLE